MKSYKKLFANSEDSKPSFNFNGKSYKYRSFSENYFNLVKDVLDGVHGKIPKSTSLNSMFGKTVWEKYEDIPESYKGKRKLYKNLGDVYVIGYKGIPDFKIAIKRISEYMDKPVVFS
jgi:hypothetical protein